MGEPQATIPSVALATALAAAGIGYCVATQRQQDADEGAASAAGPSSSRGVADGDGTWCSEAGQATLRAAEFSRIGDAVYLDHAGATLHSETQLAEVMAQLNGKLFGNPHSQNESSVRSDDAIHKAREVVLRHFNTDAQEYDIVFTANATAALKLVGESFPWSSDSEFGYTLQNHNSVLGIREYAAEHGAEFSALDYGALLGRLEAERSGLAALPRPTGSDDAEGQTRSLFAFPGECNFSGQKLDLGLIDLFQKGKGGRAASAGEWCVLLDAAKLAATSRLDLSENPVDFVCISFYKMFGYPTGLGALLVRKDRAPLLKRVYFGGGTVGAAISDEHFHVLRDETHGRFEDGTLSFLAVSSLPTGFAQLRRLGMQNISAHTHSLAVYTHNAMSALRHVVVPAASAAGDPVVRFYGYAADPARHGSVLNFNLLRPSAAGGGFVGFREVEKLACIHGIHLRTGGFCNPGATQSFLELTAQQVKEHVELGHVCWDDHDIINGVPTGSIRISFGYMSSLSDARRFVSFIEKFFVAKAVPEPQAAPALRDSVGVAEGITITQLRVYPIKSCAAMTADTWPIGPNGLLFDREWVVIDSTGAALSLKTEARLTLIKPSIDISKRLLTIQLDESNSKSKLNLPPLVISLEEIPDSESTRSMQVCGDMCTGRIYEGDATEWFTAALGRECTLARRPPDSDQRIQHDDDTKSAAAAATTIAFANEGQFLIVGEESVHDLQGRLPGDCDLQLDLMARFRPNIVVRGGAAFDEDRWTTLTSDTSPPLVLRAYKPCNRCGVVNVDTATAERHREPFLTLAQYRRAQGKVLFGSLYSIAKGATAVSGLTHRYTLDVGGKLFMA